MPNSPDLAPEDGTDARAAAAELLHEVTGHLPGGGELRTGQEQMVGAVVNALLRERHLIVEAGTGTGKSLGYLVPSATARRTVVVSTATKALQDQLMAQDLPMVAEAFGENFTYTVLKGRANYACWKKIVDLESQGLQSSIDELLPDERSGRERTFPVKDQLEALMSWAARSSSGDRAELALEPEPFIWSMVSATAQECPGAGNCAESARCFTELAKAQAASSDVTVVNTHLYGAHLSSGKQLLPAHDVVVFDEAHELEEIFSTALGTELSEAICHRLVTAARKIMAVDQLRTLTDLDAKAQELGLLLSARSGQRVLDGGGDDDLRRCLVQLEGLVRAVLESVKADGEAVVGTMKQQEVVGAATHLVGDLQRFIACGEDEVAWVSDDGRRPILFLSPIDLGPTLGRTLWGDVTAVLTSATIPANLAARLGIPRDQVDELDVGSPFDYKTNSLLYVAKHLPDRRDPSAEPAICAELAQLITAAGGRTLALFTSRKFMLEAAEAVRSAVDVTVLVQGELPKNRLLEQFRANPSTCLFATMGFWQGVDLPGETLSLVTIDRLPFGRPDDPLLNARRERAGDRAFMVVDVPRAAALLAQGAGRLIRTATDRGVVAVFDSRLATARYREALLAELPPMKRTITLSEVTAFLETIRDA